jgi:hypothetical protein
MEVLRLEKEEKAAEQREKARERYMEQEKEKEREKRKEKERKAEEKRKAAEKAKGKKGGKGKRKSTASAGTPRKKAATAKKGAKGKKGPAPSTQDKDGLGLRRSARNKRAAEEEDDEDDADDDDDDDVHDVDDDDDDDGDDDDGDDLESEEGVDGEAASMDHGEEVGETADTGAAVAVPVDGESVKDEDVAREEAHVAGTRSASRGKYFRGQRGRRGARGGGSRRSLSVQQAVEERASTSPPSPLDDTEQEHGHATEVELPTQEEGVSVSISSTLCMTNATDWS